MEILILLPQVLAKYASGGNSIRVVGDTVEELLNNLALEYPELYRCLCNETGLVRRHIHLFVNNDLVATDVRSKTLKPDDVVYVFQAVSGG